MPPPRKSKQSLSGKQRGDGVSGKKKAGGKKQFVPVSEDDYLYVGSIEEEHGDRWTIGDPDKAHRFYIHALEYYDICLTKFPNSFDAAYNKCRLEFHIYQLFYSRSVLSDSTTPSPSTTGNVPEFTMIMRTMREDRLAVQNKILEDHRHALVLAQQRRRPVAQPTAAAAGASDTEGDQQAAAPLGEPLPPPSDLLYNMAQVQLSIAEEQYSAAPYRAALETFEQTWDAQRAELEVLQNELASSGGDSASEKMEGDEEDDEDGSGQAEEYATVIEPTTYASLLETATAELSCLIPIYTISLSLSPSPTAGPQEDAEVLAQSGTVFMQRIATLLANQGQLGIDAEAHADTIADAALMATRYVAVSGYPFSTPECRPSGNLARLQAIWNSAEAAESPDVYLLNYVIEPMPVPGLTNEHRITLRNILELAPETSERYLAQSEMFTQLGLLAAAHAVEVETDAESEFGAMAWSSLSVASQALSKALNALLQQNSAPSAVVVGASMTLKSRLAQVRIWTQRGDVDLIRSNLSRVSASAAKNAVILRKNAEIYYKNAVKLASFLKNDPEMRDAAGEAAVKCAIVTGNREEVLQYGRWREIVAEAIEDAVFDEATIRAVVGE